MRGFHNSSFDPQTLVVLEAAFDEAWLTLKSVGTFGAKLADRIDCPRRAKHRYRIPAIEIARQRRIYEALCATSAKPDVSTDAHITYVKITRC